MPKIDRPPKVSDGVKRGLVRKTTKKPRITMKMMLSPPCFTSFSELLVFAFLKSINSTMKMENV